MAEVDWRVELAMPSPRKMLTPVVTVSIVLMIAGFALIHHAPAFTAAYLALNPQTIFPFRLWQLITYQFLNGCWWNLVFNGFVVLFIGSAIEREWRSRSFLLLVLTVSVLCAVVWLLVNLIGGLAFIGIGTDPYAYGLIAAFGLLFRRQRFLLLFWALEGRHLAIILIVLGLVLSIAQPMMLIWVGGAAVGYCYVKLLWRRQAGATRTRTRPMQRPPGSFVDID